jgi:3-hydroxyacyl-CoA dehydrogenase
MISLADTQPLSPTVRYGQKGHTAVILLDSPPVNGLGDTVRKGISDGINMAMSAKDISAVIIAGSGKVFCGGADIRQFNTPSALARPMLREVIAQIEGAAKPVIASIHGVALGGGLELALGCHYRIATPDATLGLPEVTLGLVPGGGGTQRLPRLIGAAVALDLVQNGKSVSGKTALQLGLVDFLTDDDPLSSAVAFAEHVIGLPTHPVVAWRMPANASEIDFEAARSRINTKAGNALAQRACIDCVEASTHMSIEAGLDYERRRFNDLVAGSESRSLRHLFFAKREAPKVAGLSGSIVLRNRQRVAVLGAGTMGSGIAMAFANAGIPVTLLEREQTALDRGLNLITRNYEITASKGKLSAEEMQRRMACITATLDFQSIDDADLVIEAVFEDMAVKKAVFRQLDQVCKPGAILATNTSRLSIDEIAASTSRPQDVIGLHFFSPANVMKLLEVVQGEVTASDVIATCMKMAQSIGKIPVLVKVCEGFVGNRMLTPYWREAGFLLEEGASPQQIDEALTQFGMAMGPLAMADLAGMDINWATRKRLAPTRPKHLRYSKVADGICELGRFGQKTNAGYYRYEPGSRTPIPDPVVDALIERSAKEAGIERRLVSNEEIVERCVLALVNEGARILEDKIAQRSSDVDVVYVHGYGFPACRGGPMFYAETLGLGTVLERILSLQNIHGEHWEPAPLLVRLVSNGQRGFADAE